MYCLLKLYRIDDLWWPWRSFKGHLMIRLRKSENKDNIFKIQICDVATRSILVIYMAGKYYTYTIISTNKISGIFKCIAMATAQTFKGIMEILQFFLIYLFCFLIFLFSSCNMEMTHTRLQYKTFKSFDKHW